MNPRPKGSATTRRDPPYARPDDWTRQAACAEGHDPELWFPRYEAHVIKAAAICYQCPVIRECDRYITSLPRHDRYGVWAGRLYKGADTK